MKRYSTPSNILLVFVICAVALSACITIAVPKEGVWYNEELMIEIDFNQAIDKWKPIVRMYNQDGTYQSAVCMFGYVGEFSIQDDNLMVWNTKTQEGSRLAPLDSFVNSDTLLSQKA